LTAVVDQALGGEADRDALMVRLARRGIDSRPFFYPNHLMPAFSGGTAQVGSLPVTESISFRGLALPSGAGLSDSEIDRSIAAYLAERKPLA
jgi:perosamine synthetase